MLQQLQQSGAVVYGMLEFCLQHLGWPLRHHTLVCRPALGKKQPRYCGVAVPQFVLTGLVIDHHVAVVLHLIPTHESEGHNQARSGDQKTGQEPEDL